MLTREYLRILEEGITDECIVVVTAQVEEVDCDLLARDGHLLDSVVDADCGDVLLHEPSLTVALDNAAFADLLIADRQQLHENLVALHSKQIVNKSVSLRGVLPIAQVVATPNVFEPRCVQSVAAQRGHVVLE